MLSRRAVVAAVSAGLASSFWLQRQHRVPSPPATDQPDCQFLSVPAGVNDEPGPYEVAPSGGCEGAALVRQSCVLARLSRMSAWRARRLAQRISWRCALLLAVWRRGDLALFLPPPPPHPSSPTPLRQLQQVLDSVLTDDECGQFWKSAGVKALPPAHWRCSVDSRYCLTQRDPSDLEVSDMDELSWRASGLGRLRYSTLSAARQVLSAVLSGSSSAALYSARHQLLSALSALLPKHADDAVLCSLAVRLFDRLSVAALAGDGGDAGEFTASLHAGGWLGALAAWSRERDVTICLPAARAVRRLAVATGLLSVADSLPGCIHVAEPGSVAAEARVDYDVVFVHGLLGGAAWTWRQRDCGSGVAPPRLWQQHVLGWPRGEAVDDSSLSYSQCWPRDWLPEDLRARVRVLLVDYDSWWSRRRPQCHPSSGRGDWLEERAAELLSALREVGVGGRPVVFVCHSLGGLLVKQLLVMAADSARAEERAVWLGTRGLVFAAVPHLGSAAASLLHSRPLHPLFQPSLELSQLCSSNQQLHQLHSQFEQLVEVRRPRLLSVLETEGTRLAAGWSVKLVEDLSADAVSHAETLASPGFNHLDVCKPHSRHCPIYSRIVSFINECA